MGVEGDLLNAARQHYGVPDAPTLDAVSRIIEEWGGEELPLERFKDDLYDEFVDPDLAVKLYGIGNADFIRSHVTAEESEVYGDEPDEDFDPYEYGPDQVEWVTMAHSMETLQLVLIVVQQDAAHPEKPGGFRVYGAGQWFREALWAATGVLPRDLGTAEGELFRQALKAGRHPEQARPRE